VTSDSGTLRSAPPRLYFSVAPEPSRLQRARDRIRGYLTLHCTDETAINDIVLAIEEACTNAIRRSGSDEDIEIRLRFEGKRLRAMVTDKGRGFAVETFDATRLPEPLLDHGRGLYLIAKLCDELHLRREASGLTVDMVKADLPSPTRSGEEGAGRLAEHETSYWQRRGLHLRDEMAEAPATATSAACTVRLDSWRPSPVCAACRLMSSPRASCTTSPTTPTSSQTTSRSSRSGWPEPPGPGRLRPFCAEDAVWFQE